MLTIATRQEFTRTASSAAKLNARHDFPSTPSDSRHMLFEEPQEIASHDFRRSKPVIVVLTDGSVRLYHEPTIRVAEVLRDFPHHTLATGVNAQRLAADRLLHPGGAYLLLLDTAAPSSSKKEWKGGERSDAVSCTGDDDLGSRSFDGRVLATGCFARRKPLLPRLITGRRSSGENYRRDVVVLPGRVSAASSADFHTSKPLRRSTSTQPLSLPPQGLPTPLETPHGGPSAVGGVVTSQKGPTPAARCDDGRCVTSRGSAAISSTPTSTPVPPAETARPASADAAGDTSASPRRARTTSKEGESLVSPPIDSSISPRGLFVSSTRKVSRALAALPLPKYSVGGGAVAKASAAGGIGGASASLWSLMGLVSPRGPRRNAVDENTAAEGFYRGT